MLVKTNRDSDITIVYLRYCNKVSITTYAGLNLKYLENFYWLIFSQCTLDSALRIVTASSDIFRQRYSG